MKILIIEDEKSLLDSIVTYFEKLYQVESALDFHSAIQKIYNFDYDCIILDINLPGGNGLDILHRLKEDHKTDTVIIISARGALDDKIKGLEMGADDYLAKPFHLAELGARIASVLRRSKYNGSNILHINDLLIDVDAKTIQFGQKLISLTRKEYDLLIFFVVNKNRVISKDTIAEHLLGEQVDFMDNYDIIYTHIKNLKRKLAAAGAEKHLKSIYGMGYKYEVQ